MEQSETEVKKAIEGSEPEVSTETVATQVVPEKTVSAHTVEKSNRNLKLAVVILGCSLLLTMGIYFKAVFVAATVNGSPVSRLSVIKELEKTAGKQTLDTLITKRLIEQEADAKGITASDEEVQVEVTKIEEQIKAQGSTLEAELATAGISMEQFRSEKALFVKLQKMLGDTVGVTDAEVAAFIAENSIEIPKGSETEIMNGVREQLKGDKSNTAVGELIAELKSAAKINYFVTY